MMAADRSPARHEEAVVDERHPWPGLVPFREAYSRFFFGRSLEQEELLRSIRRGITTLLFGESGLGKTSLLQAGLFPRLRENGYLPVLVRLDYAAEALPPSEQIKRLLNQAIADAGLDASRRIEPQETLWEYFHRRELALVDRSGEPIIPIIVFDQFEEFFTLGLNQRKADCQIFLSELSDLTENRPPAAVKARLERSPDQIVRYVFNRDDYRIVITLREDFLPALEMFRTSAPSLGRNRFRLTRMKGPQALQAVVEPGRDIVSEEVAWRIVSLVGGGPANDVSLEANKDIEVEPSLLSLFCSELNERRLAADQAEITAELVERSRRDILRSFYERALNDQPQAVREFVEDQLVTDSGARDSIARERAERLLADKGVPASVIDELVRRRLLHIEERREGPRVELIHDVLLDIVRQGKAERGSLALRQALARTRKRYIIRAGAAVAIVILLAGTVTFVAVETARLRNEQNQKLIAYGNQLQELLDLRDEQNRKLIAYGNQLQELLDLRDEQNQKLLAYGNNLQGLLESLMPVLGKFVERSEAQTLSGDKFLDEQVRPLMNKIIALADQMRGPGYDPRFMRAKALSLVILAKVANADDSPKYIEDATQIATELLRQGKNFDDISKGYDTFDAITQVWESRRNTDLALISVRQSLEILQQIDFRVLNVDQRNWFVGSAVLRQANILRKASRFDEAEDSLRWGLRELFDADKAPLVSLQVDLYNNLGEVLLSARDRATDGTAKRRAIDAALIEFERAWDKVVVYLRLQDSISTRNWMARLAKKIAGLHQDIRNVERARIFYNYQLRVRRSLVPDDSKPLTISHDVDGAKRDLAAALRDIGYLEQTQGDKSKAIEYYNECVGSMEALVRKDPAPTNQQSLGFCYVGLADALLADGKRAGALTNYQKALTIREALAAAEPNNADRQSGLAYVYAALADALLADGKRAEALSNGWKALAIREKLAAAEPANAGRQSDLAYVYEKLGDALLAGGERTEALANYQNALAIREKLAVAEPTTARQSDLSYVYRLFADALLADGKRAEALTNYRKALAIREQLAAAEPANASRQGDLSYVYRVLADALLADGKRAEALTNYRKAVAIREQLATAEPDNADRQTALIFVYRKLADALLADGKRAEALTNYQKVLAIREKLAAQTEQAEAAANGKPGAATADKLGAVAWSALFAQDFDKALAASDRALALAPDKVWLLTNRAHALMFLGRVDDARSLYLQYRGAKNVQGGKSWETVILEDFAELRKAGLMHRLMDEIEKRFTASG